MCHFISWIEYEKKLYYIEDKDLDTKEGKELIAYCKNSDDLMGHGAIRKYYGLEQKGKDHEITDFSNPKKIPSEIVKKIKQGVFSRIYKEVFFFTAPALAKYNKVTDTALAEYNKVKAPAWAKYNKVKDTAWAEYTKVTAPALAEYTKVTALALAEYTKVTDTAYRQIISQKKNRRKEWE